MSIILLATAFFGFFLGVKYLFGGNCYYQFVFSCEFKFFQRLDGYLAQLTFSRTRGKTGQIFGVKACSDLRNLLRFTQQIDSFLIHCVFRTQNSTQPFSAFYAARPERAFTAGAHA